MPGPFAFDQILASDPSNPSMVARNSEVLLFAPGDDNKVPLVLWDLSHTLTITNPVQTNDLGFGPGFLHDTLDLVAWESGSLSGLFPSYRGLKDVAEAAQYAAEVAAAAAAASAADAAAVVVAGVPSGGATGQVLAKVSGTSYDAGWVDPPAGGGGGAANFSELLGTLAPSQLAAGGVMFVSKVGSTWGARPTSRADVLVIWIGADPSPSIVDSGTGGMLRNRDVRWAVVA